MIAILQRLKSNTYQFSILLAILGVVQASSGVFTQYMTPTVAGWFTVVVGIVVAILREITTKPLNEK